MKNMTGLAKGRLWFYAGCVVAALMSAMEIGSFDVLTGDVTIHSFNLYKLIQAVSGIAGPGVAVISVLRGWKTHK